MYPENAARELFPTLRLSYGTACDARFEISERRQNGRYECNYNQQVPCTSDRTVNHDCFAVCSVVSILPFSYFDGHFMRIFSAENEPSCILPTTTTCSDLSKSCGLVFL